MNISLYKIFSAFRIPKSGILGQVYEHGLPRTFSGDRGCVFNKRGNRYWEDTTMPTILPRLYGHTGGTLIFQRVPFSQNTI